MTLCVYLVEERNSNFRKEWTNSVVSSYTYGVKNSVLYKRNENATRIFQNSGIKENGRI